jgi:hypothetical protein
VGQFGDSIKTTLETYAHLFDEAAVADESRAAMEAAVGNAVVTRGAETTETAREAEVVNIASVQGNAGDTRRLKGPRSGRTVSTNSGSLVRAEYRHSR